MNDAYKRSKAILNLNRKGRPKGAKDKPKPDTQWVIDQKIKMKRSAIDLLVKKMVFLQEQCHNSLVSALIGMVTTGNIYDLRTNGILIAGGKTLDQESIALIPSETLEYLPLARDQKWMIDSLIQENYNKVNRLKAKIQSLEDTDPRYVVIEVTPEDQAAFPLQVVCPRCKASPHEPPLKAQDLQESPNTVGQESPIDGITLAKKPMGGDEGRG